MQPFEQTKRLSSIPPIERPGSQVALGKEDQETIPRMTQPEHGLWQNLRRVPILCTGGTHDVC